MLSCLCSSVLALCEKYKMTLKMLILNRYLYPVLINILELALTKLENEHNLLSKTRVMNQVLLYECSKILLCFFCSFEVLHGLLILYFLMLVHGSFLDHHMQLKTGLWLTTFRFSLLRLLWMMNLKVMKLMVL